MSKNLRTVFQAIITTTVLAITFTFAQGSLSTTTANDFGFFGDMSVKVYCTFSNFIPGSDNSLCNTDILVHDTSPNSATSTENLNGNTIVKDSKISQINKIIGQGLAGQNVRIAYVPVKGDKGADGTTTIIYQSTVPGAPQAGPTAYIYAGGNTNDRPYQTTVPGDIFSTFIHQLRSEVIVFGDMFGNNAEIANITASTTNTINLGFQQATGTNLTATGTITTNNLIGNNSTVTNSTSTNIFSTNASLTNATTSNLFAVFANIWDFYFHNATGTNLSITNITSTGTFAVASGTIASTTIQNLNVNNTIGNLATFTSATTTNVFATNASLTNATTTNFFAAWANFLNLIVSNLQFANATGTNLQVANASTTNLSATGTSVITNLNSSNATITNSTSTNIFATNMSVANASVISATITNSTSTKMFATNASITNATTTNLFASIFSTLTSTIASLLFTNATGTNATTTNFFSTSIFGTGSVIGNATSTNIFTTNFVGNNSTSTNLFSNSLWSINSSSTNSTTTNSFVGNLVATLANFVNFKFQNATGTNITATGTATLASLISASSTLSNATILSGNATVTTLVSTNSTSTANFTAKLIATNATVTNILTVNGKVGIQNTDPAYILHVGSASTANNIAVARFENGNGTCTITPSNFFGVTCTSDENKKKDITDFTENTLEKINQVKVSNFRMKNAEDNSPLQTGFIAQQLETIFPNLVITGEDGFKEVGYVGMIPLLTKAIQEMKQSFFSEKVITNQLCIGQTCINESDLQQFKAWQAAQNQPAPAPVVPDSAPAI